MSTAIFFLLHCFLHGSVASISLKNAGGGGKVRSLLMGHTNYNSTTKKYQSNSMEDLQEVTASII